MDQVAACTLGLWPRISNKDLYRVFTPLATIDPSFETVSVISIIEACNEILP